MGTTLASVLLALLSLLGVLARLYFSRDTNKEKSLEDENKQLHKEIQKRVDRPRTPDDTAKLFKRRIAEARAREKKSK